MTLLPFSNSQTFDRKELPVLDDDDGVWVAGCEWRDKKPEALSSAWWVVFAGHIVQLLVKEKRSKKISDQQGFCE